MAVMRKLHAAALLSALESSTDPNLRGITQRNKRSSSEPRMPTGSKRWAVDRRGGVRRILAAVCIACSLMSLTACVGVPSQRAQTLDENALTIAVSVSPSEISFGDVAVGNTATKPITVYSTGTDEAVITQAAVAGAGYSISSLTIPAAIPAGTSRTFQVLFAPKATGPANGALSLSVRGIAKPLELSLRASGSNTIYSLEVSPTSLSFGNVAVGSRGTRNLNLINSGTVDITVSQLSLGSTVFSVEGLSLPKTIASGQRLAFDVIFTPAGAGQTQDALQVTSRASAAPVLVPINGTGVVAGPSSHEVVLTWNAAASAVVGYHVYRGGGTTGPFLKLTQATVPDLIFTDSTVVGGQTYRYAVTSVDGAGAESSYSNAVSATIPVP